MSLALQFPLSDLTFFYCSCSTFLGIIKDLLRYKEPKHSWHCHPVSKKHNCSLFWLIHLFWWGMERGVHCGVKEEDWKQLLLSPKTIKLLFSFWKDVLHYTSKTCCTRSQMWSSSQGGFKTMYPMWREMWPEAQSEDKNIWKGTHLRYYYFSHYIFVSIDIFLSCKLIQICFTFHKLHSYLTECCKLPHRVIVSQVRCCSTNFKHLSILCGSNPKTLLKTRFRASETFTLCELTVTWWVIRKLVTSFLSHGCPA